MSEVNMVFSVLLGVLIVALLVGFFLVVPVIAVAWTHRPDMTVRELIREAVQEIKNGE